MVTTKKPEITEYTMKLANKIIVYEFTNGKGAVDPKTYKKGTNNNRWFRVKADEKLQEISTGFLCDYLNIRMNTLDVDKIGYIDVHTTAHISIFPTRDNLVVLYFAESAFQ